MRKYSAALRPRHRELAMPGPATTRDMQVARGKSLAAACSVACLEWASEPRLAAPLPALPLAAASELYRALTRVRGPRTRSIGQPIGIAWQDGFVSAC